MRIDRIVWIDSRHFADVWTDRNVWIDRNVTKTYGLTETCGLKRVD